jgi:dihydroorotase
MSIIVRSPADFHVHLRQGSFSELITPHIRKGGFDLAYVMVRLATSEHASGHPHLST